MRRLPSNSLPVTALYLLFLAGCAPPIGSRAGQSCAELDVAVGATSKQISAVAISRGKVDRLSIPFWLPGGQKAVSAVKARQTRRIERLDGQLASLRSERQSRCP
jgi:hypothetical protein